MSAAPTGVPVQMAPVQTAAPPTQPGEQQSAGAVDRTEFDSLKGMVEQIATSVQEISAKVSELAGDSDESDDENNLPPGENSDPAANSELANLPRAASERITAMGAELRQANERIATMQANERAKTFNDMAKGRHEGLSGKRWFGETKGHVDMLEALTQQFGENHPRVKAYITQQEAVAAAIDTSKIFGETGSHQELPITQTQPKTALDLLNDLANAKVEASGGKLTYARAYAEVSKANPDLVRQYNEEHIQINTALAAQNGR